MCFVALLDVAIQPRLDNSSGLIYIYIYMCISQFRVHLVGVVLQLFKKILHVK